MKQEGISRRALTRLIAVCDARTQPSVTSSCVQQSRGLMHGLLRCMVLFESGTIESRTVDLRQHIMRCDKYDVSLYLAGYRGSKGCASNNSLGTGRSTASHKWTATHHCLHVGVQQYVPRLDVSVDDVTIGVEEGKGPGSAAGNCHPLIPRQGVPTV